jgi:hypothetical protein
MHWTARFGPDFMLNAAVPPPAMCVVRAQSKTMAPQITQIPIEGGSGLTPTGAMQFRNDWPGLFLRGDKAVWRASRIRGLQQRLSEHPDPIVGAVLFELDELAGMIEQDVVVRDEPA